MQDRRALGRRRCDRRLRRSRAHEIPGFRPGHIEVAASANANCVHPLATVHRFAGLKTTAVKGIRVTTYARTMFDVASRTSVWMLERGLDDGLVNRRIAIDDLTERLEFYEGSRRDGLPRIRPLVLERAEDGYVPPTTELEAMLLRLIDRLPVPPTADRQARFPWRPEAPNRVDVLLPDHRLILEADGRRWHTRVADFDRDRWRDNLAVANGFRTMRFTWLHLTDTPDEALDLLGQTLCRAA